MKRRHWFTAPFVVTAAAAPLACSSSTGRGERRDFPPGVKGSWYVMRDVSSCSASAPMSCPKNATCNPPPPQAIECPSGMGEQVTVRVIELGDGTCAMLPDGCTREACAQGPTPCPVPWGERLPTLEWAVNLVDGKCVASPGPRTRDEPPRSGVEVPCLPFENKGGSIDRAAAGADCHACALSPCDPATSPKVACPPESP